MLRKCFLISLNTVLLQCYIYTNVLKLSLIRSQFFCAYSTHWIHTIILRRVYYRLVLRINYTHLYILVSFWFSSRIAVPKHCGLMAWLKGREGNQATQVAGQDTCAAQLSQTAGQSACTSTCCWTASWAAHTSVYLPPCHSYELSCAWACRLAHLSHGLVLNSPQPSSGLRPRCWGPLL